MSKSVPHAAIAELRAATGIPVLWCHRWLESGPQQLIERLLAGDCFRQIIRDLAVAGVSVPCPECGAPFQVHGASGFCSQSGCREFFWTGTTIADREAADRATDAAPDSQT